MQVERVMTTSYNQQRFKKTVKKILKKGKTETILEEKINVIL